MIQLRSGICLAVFFAVACSADAGHGVKKSGCCGTAMGAYSPPIATYGAPLPDAAPMSGIMPGYVGGPLGGGFRFGEPVPGYPVPMRFPTWGIVPPVAPGVELVW
jgi:hypothetical protein